jgi:hypothetical protein
MNLIWILPLAVAILFIIYLRIRIVRTIRQVTGMQGSRPYPWTKRIVRDGRGNVVSESWFKDDQPDLYETNGLDNLAQYVEKLLAFEGWFASILISTLDSKRGFSLFKTEGISTIHFIFGSESNPQDEQSARAFFSARNLAKQDDYLDALGSTRFISWIVPTEKDELLTLSLQVASELCKITTSEGLKIKYSETPVRPEMDPNHSVMFSSYTTRTVFRTKKSARKPDDNQL